MRAELRSLPLLVMLACGGTGTSDRAPVADPVRDLPQAALTKLARTRIYFGHQSVGYDIVEGLAALGRERPGLALRIVESRAPDALATPALAHAKNGRNEEPLTKIRDFAETLEGRGLGATTDVALFKFCYVDFPPGTDVESVFAEYRSTLARLRQRFPGVKFVHVTSPLTVVESGPKALVKRLLGRRLVEAESNVVRDRFNALMRAEYAGREPLFDLAAIESTGPDGRPVRFEHGGRSTPALAREWASDGRHLNSAGARWAAAHLLETLATVVE